MKKWVSFVAIVSLLVVSSILIYKEAIAIPQLCDTMEQECLKCGGTFHIFWCEPRGALIYCEFQCSDVHPEYPLCEWETDFGGICVL